MKISYVNGKKLPTSLVNQTGIVLYKALLLISSLNPGQKKKKINCKLLYCAVLMRDLVQ